MSCDRGRGMDDSLLFFFLILVLLFCMPGAFGCGESCGSPCDSECC